MLRDYPGDKKKFVRKICKSTGWPERLSYIYSVSIFLIITTLLSWRANFDKPLRCMMTADNPGRWVDYYDDLCYINGTYRLGEKDTFVSSRNQTLEKAEPINYYQWAHYILLFQTLLWYVPHAFWRFTRSCTAFHLMSILAYGIKNEKKPSYIPWAQHVQEHLKFAYKVQKRPSVVYYYLITKWLYVGIAFLQLSIITYFIGEGDYFWGLKKFMMATSGGRFTWHQLEEFPFVSYCDSIKFELGQWKPSSLECVMPMNMFLDKAYVFFWFWIVFVLVVQFFTALHATILYMIPTWTHRELCSILQLGERDPKRRVVHIFLKEHLHLEGFLLLRILKENWSDLIAYEMGKQLWTISEGI